MADAVGRAAAPRESSEHVASCTKFALAQGRTPVVFGSGSPNADLMFVGEAPGFHEDQQGVPFVGQAGKLLDKLLAGIGMTAPTFSSRTSSSVAPRGTVTRCRMRSPRASRTSVSCAGF